MKTAYFDCFSGISGDMCLGALIDAGASPDALIKGLRHLPVKGFSIDVKKVRRAGIRATAVTVNVTSQKAGSRRFPDIRDLITKAKFPGHIKVTGLGIFKAMFTAEARVHGGRFDRVHLHELGAVDALVDIMGTLLLLEDLGIEDVQTSPVNLGSGTVRTAHGELPVPAPATMELLKNVPVYGSGEGFELTTPTGAAIVSSLCTGFGPVPPMKVLGTGYGAGKKDFKRGPNVLRVIVGKSGSSAPGVVVVETNIDDMNPQVFGHVMDRLFKAGALDAWLTQIIMKKGRPGVKLSVLCEEQLLESVTGILLEETTTLGVRYWNASRNTLDREICTVKTKYGPVRFKHARTKGGRTKSSPEYDDLKRMADRFDIPLVELFRLMSSSSGPRWGPVSAEEICPARGEFANPAVPRVRYVSIITFSGKQWFSPGCFYAPDR